VAEKKVKGKESRERRVEESLQEENFFKKKKLWKTNN
jgi:hypothetical protein